MGDIIRHARTKGLSKKLLREPWTCTSCGATGIAGAEAFASQQPLRIVCVKCVAAGAPIGSKPEKKHYPTCTRCGRRLKRAEGLAKVCEACRQKGKKKGKRRISDWPSSNDALGRRLPGSFESGKRR